MALVTGNLTKKCRYIIEQAGTNNKLATYCHNPIKPAISKSHKINTAFYPYFCADCIIKMKGKGSIMRLKKSTVRVAIPEGYEATNEYGFPKDGEHGTTPKLIKERKLKGYLGLVYIRGSWKYFFTRLEKTINDHLGKDKKIEWMTGFENDGPWSGAPYTILKREYVYCLPIYEGEIL